MAFEHAILQSVRGPDCDTEHYLVVAKPRERLAESKQRYRSLM